MLPNREKLVLSGNDDSTKIYMEYGAYLKIIRYSKAGSSDGSRGVLLGISDKDGIDVQIALEALYFGDEGLEAPSFTKQSWSRICAEIETYYPELQILGQYSTHLKVTADEMDYAMQQSFFGNSSNLLFIFDPLENTEGIYLFKDNAFTKIKGMYLYDKYDNEIDLRMKDSLTRTIDKEFELRTNVLKKINKRIMSQNRTYSIIFVTLLIAFFYLVFQNMEITKNLTDYENRIKTTENSVHSIESVIEEYKSQKAVITPEPVATPKPSPKPSKRSSS